MPELLDAESLECGDEDVLHASGYLCRADRYKISPLQCGLAFDENGRNQRENGARNGHPNGQVSHPLSGALWKPCRIVENHPKPRCDDPGPLPNELRNGHDVGAFVKVLTDFIPHGHVRHAEDGQSEVKDERPSQEINEIVQHTISFVQLPHGDVGNPHEDCSDENVLPAPSPFRAGIVRNESHDGVGYGVKNARQELDDPPEKGGKTEVLNQHDDEYTERSGKHLVGQHTEAKCDLLAH